MQEHGCKHVCVLPSGVGDTHEPLADRKAYAGAYQAGEFTGNQPEIANGLGQTELLARTLYEDPGERTQRDDRHRDVCGALRFVLVVIRDHVTTIVSLTFN
jgi:hypothetical protein